MRALRGGKLYDPRWGARMKGEGPFAEQVADMFQVSCRKFGLNREGIALSIDAFRPLTPAGQLNLFD